LDYFSITDIPQQTWQKNLQFYFFFLDLPTKNVKFLPKYRNFFQKRLFSSDKEKIPLILQVFLSNRPFSAKKPA